MNESPFFEDRAAHISVLFSQVKRVAVLPGDGIGPEVMEEAMKVK